MRNESLNQPTEKQLEPFVQRMRNKGMPPLAIDTFSHHYTKLLSGAQTTLPSASLKPVGTLPTLDALDDLTQTGQRALHKTAIFKLNGGLGTSMGLSKAKSLLPVKDGLSFLDIVLQQTYHLRESLQSAIPLVFMNSFSTDEDTRAILKNNPQMLEGQGTIPLSFLQHQIPKIDQANLQPVRYDQEPELEWCPPGHGDFYTALISSGVLDRLLENGFEYAFISNIDNLGATLDPKILGFLVTEHIPFLMEVTQRTKADRKGGHLARSSNGPLLLRERAHCPDEEQDDFQDIEKYQFFNTNNLWIHLPSLAQKLTECHGILDLPLIINRKTIHPSDPQSPSVYQLETAMGSAIGCFPDAQALVVPRTRFAPVKTTNDLLALWSDLFYLTKDSHVVSALDRFENTILIDLDPDFYQHFSDFQSAFAQGAPSLLHCQRLFIRGRFSFENNVTITGCVTLRNRSRHEILIPSGTRLTSRPGKPEKTVHS